MCSGPLMGKLLLFSIPLMLSGILQLLFNAADIIVVGQFAGDSSLAAVGSTSSLISLLVNFFLGISVGTNVLAARARGANQPQEVEDVIQTSILTAALGGCMMVFVGFFLSRPLLELMGTDESILDQAALYMQIYFVGVPASLVYNFGAAVLRAAGDTRRPLIFLVISGAVNVALNLVLVILFQLDVAGVAIATVVSQVISAGLVLNCLHHGPEMCRLDLHNLRFSPRHFVDILRLGLPAGLQSVVFNISNVLIQASINSFRDPLLVAGNTAAGNIESFVYVAMNAVYQASLSFTSQNMGARLYRRVDQILVRCLVIVTGVGLLLGIGAWKLGPWLLNIYSNDPQVISYGLIRLSIVSATYFLCGVMENFCGSIRGMGYSILPMLVSLSGACVFRVIWIYTAFRFDHTLFTLYISYPISWLLTAGVHCLCFLIIRQLVRRRDPLPVQN